MRLSGIYDPNYRAIQKKIDEQKADFNDTARLSRLLSQILGEKLAKHILELPPDEGRSELCQQLLKDFFDEINHKLAQVQSSLDKKNGISLNPVQPSFPTERAQNVAGSLNDTTEPDSTIQRRCRNAVSNVANAMHDSFIQVNAKFRNDAGLFVQVTRTGGAECCDWCAQVSGTFWGYNRDLREVFRRHDNCTCTITYSSSKTRSRLVGESDGAGGTTSKWVESQKSWQEKPILPDARPTRFTPEQAKRFETEQLQKQGLVRDGNGVKYVGNELTVPHDAVSGDAFPQGQIAITFEELQRNAELVNRLLDNYTERKSKWSKKAKMLEENEKRITINGELYEIYGKKNWDCSITIRDDAEVKTLIHELLHADYKTMEEATVELYAQEICKKKGIPYQESYKEIVDCLRKINEVLQIGEDDFEFAKKLFDIDMKMRYNWIKEQYDKAMKEGTVSPFNVPALEYNIEFLRWAKI